MTLPPYRAPDDKQAMHALAYGSGPEGFKRLKEGTEMATMFEKAKAVGAAWRSGTATIERDHPIFNDGPDRVAYHGSEELILWRDPSGLAWCLFPLKAVWSDNGYVGQPDGYVGEDDRASRTTRRTIMNALLDGAGFNGRAMFSLDRNRLRFSSRPDSRSNFRHFDVAVGEPVPLPEGVLSWHAAMSEWTRSKRPIKEVTE